MEATLRDGLHLSSVCLIRKTIDFLKTIPIGIDARKDGVQFNLNLFSKGTKANYRDDFPLSIVRNTGARIEIINNAFNNLQISNIYLGIVINGELLEAWACSPF